MIYRTMVLLLLMVISWGIWRLFHIGPVLNDKGKPPDVDPPAAPVPAPPPRELSPDRTLAPLEPTGPIPDPDPEPPPLSEEQRLESLDRRVRDCIERQKEYPLPFLTGQMADTTGRTFLQVAVVRLEPDGIHIRHGGGVVKLPFTQLPQDLKMRFHIEDELAIRYREVIEQKRLEAELERRQEEIERIRKEKERTLWNTPAASVEPDAKTGLPKRDR